MCPSCMVDRLPPYRRCLLGVPEDDVYLQQVRNSCLFRLCEGLAASVGRSPCDSSASSASSEAGAPAPASSAGDLHEELRLSHQILQLVRQGADANATNSENRNALQVAVQAGNLTAAVSLSAAGADRGLQNQYPTNSRSVPPEEQNRSRRSRSRTPSGRGRAMRTPRDEDFYDGPNVNVSATSVRPRVSGRGVDGRLVRGRGGRPASITLRRLNEYLSDGGGRSRSWSELLQLEELHARQAAAEREDAHLSRLSASDAIPIVGGFSDVDSLAFRQHGRLRRARVRFYVGGFSGVVYLLGVAVLGVRAAIGFLLAFALDAFQTGCGCGEGAAQAAGPASVATAREELAASARREAVGQGALLVTALLLPTLTHLPEMLDHQRILIERWRAALEPEWAIDSRCRSEWLA